MHWFTDLQVDCCTKDLHSGVFGGTVHEGMADLIYLMNTLVDNKGKILIPGQSATHSYFSLTVTHCMCSVFLLGNTTAYILVL